MKIFLINIMKLYPKVFWQKYYFNKDIEIYSKNSYYVEPGEEYYDEICTDLFLETIRKIL